jgi:predicted nucleic acid-binding protein
VARRLRETARPWPSLVLDSQGLWSVATNTSEDATAALDLSRLAGVPVIVPAVVLAETLRGSPEDARANQVLKKLAVEPITDRLGRLAASLKGAAAMSGVEATIDALVVAVSIAYGGGIILTSDPDDINRLAAGAPEVRIRAVRV